MHRHSGYTLLELLVGTVLLTIAIALAVSRVRDSGDEKEVLAAGAPVVRALNLAADRSRTGISHRFCFEGATQSFWVEAQEPGSERFVATGSPRQVPQTVLVRIELPEKTGTRDSRLNLGGATRGATVETIDFRGDGTADAGTLEFTDRLGRRLLIRVVPETGRIRVVEM